jgi:Protein of unknown function (DUF732)
MAETTALVRSEFDLSRESRFAVAANAERVRCDSEEVKRMALTAMTVLLGVLCACATDPPAPTPEQAFQSKAQVIDGRLSDGASSLALGKAVCSKIAAGRPIDEVARESQRFTGGESLLSAEQSRKLVESARQTLCP